MTPDQRARKSALHLMARDAATAGLGARLDQIAEDRAVLSMNVAAHMLNGHGICHGGYIFTLADSAFAFACNSRNAVNVAQSNSITYLSPGAAGERLTATAICAGRAGRSSTFDVTVTGADGRHVALFRGLARQLPGQHFDESQEPAS